MNLTWVIPAQGGGQSCDLCRWDPGQRLFYFRHLSEELLDGEFNDAHHAYTWSWDQEQRGRGAISFCSPQCAPRVCHGEEPRRARPDARGQADADEARWRRGGVKSSRAPLRY